MSPNRYPVPSLRTKDLSLVAVASAGLLLLFLDPAEAGNKFHTISGGVVGSSEEKRLWTRIVLASFGGVLLVSAVAAAFMPHNNPLFMNYLNWRTSATLMALVGSLAMVGAYLL